MISLISRSTLSKKAEESSLSRGSVPSFHGLSFRLSTVLRLQHFCKENSSHVIFITCLEGFKKNILCEKSPCWTSVLINLQSCSTQPLNLSKNRAHVRPSCRIAESSNIFTSEPPWYGLFSQKLQF